jgi:hypothetical protein
VVAVFLLPSSLNLPQSNPTTVLEYAPVPPEDDDPPPPADGNVSSLGLGTSGTIRKPAIPSPPPVIEGLGGKPQQKRCIGDPPRQTEDPASPPCVPFFEGDNFGSTYQGVKGEEITVLGYFDVGNYLFTATGQSEIAPANGTYVDIDQPDKPPCRQGTSNTDPNECDHVIVRMLKGFSRYFNARFQTYNRHVHFWAYFTNASTAAARRSDAVANWDKLKPFAVIDQATFFGFNQEYQTALNQLGVLTFSSTEAGLSGDFYRANAPLAWGFYPDLEHWEAMYSSYVCQKIKPHPVRRFGISPGQGAPNGQPRKFGIYYPIDPAEPGLQTFSESLLDSLADCGVDPVTATYSKSGYAVDSDDTGTEAIEAVARFRDAEVTTVLYVGTETRFGNAADAVKWYPEIVVAGDLENDNNFIGTVQNQNVWRNASAMTYHVRINRLEDSPGYRAYKEGYPAGDDFGGVFARDQYRDVFQLFQGIQVAGPRLTPASVDKGFHAIPERPSTDPFTPAFFFDPDDYTSTKDAAEQWWDTNGRTATSNQPGCWRMVREGRRFLAGKWEGGDDVFRNTSDPCTAYGGSIRQR